MLISRTAEKKIRDEGYKAGVADEKMKRKEKLPAERKKHESEKLNSFSRGKLDGLQEARRILNHRIGTEGDDSDDRSVHQLYRALNEVRKIDKKAGKLYNKTHDKFGRTV